MAPSRLQIPESTLRDSTGSRSRRAPKPGQADAGSVGLMEQQDRRNGAMSQEERLAYGLGLAGIALGVAELLVPRRLARAAGLPTRHHRVIRMMGVREIASGLGIMMLPGPTAAVWSRVAGDVVDLACLGAAFTSRGADRARLAKTLAAIAGATALDLVCAQQMTRGIETRRGAMPILATLTINRSQEELYRFWRDFSNLPRLMNHLRSVEVIDDRRSHWTATGPGGSSVEWDAEITDDRPNEMITWRTVEGSDVDHRGVIRFEAAAGGRGTMVTVEMQYAPPGGTLGSAVAAWFGDDPRQSIKMGLRRFKQVMETGEVITTEGQPAGRPRSTSWRYDQSLR